jgi:hypothetical protein
MQEFSGLALANNYPPHKSLVERRDNTINAKQDNNVKKSQQFQ